MPALTGNTREDFINEVNRATKVRVTLRSLDLTTDIFALDNSSESDLLLSIQCRGMSFFIFEDDVSEMTPTEYGWKVVQSGGEMTLTFITESFVRHESMGFELKLLDHCEWVPTSHTLNYGDPNGSVCLIEFNNNHALYIDGEIMGVVFEDSGAYALHTLNDVAESYAVYKGLKAHSLKIDADFLEDDFEEFAMNVEWEELADFAFKGIEPKVF